MQKAGLLFLKQDAVTQNNPRRESERLTGDAVVKHLQFQKISHSNQLRVVRQESEKQKRHPANNRQGIEPATATARIKVFLSCACNTAVKIIKYIKTMGQ